MAIVTLSNLSSSPNLYNKNVALTEEVMTIIINFIVEANYQLLVMLVKLIMNVL